MSLFVTLNNRNKIYFDTTQEILSKFVERLNKAVLFFMKADRDVTWGSVEFVPGSNHFVYITGMLSVQLGDVVVYGNNKTNVDEDFLKNNSSQTLVRVMLSIDDLENAEPKVLYNKIRDFYELSAIMSQEQLVKLLSARKLDSLEELLQELGGPMVDDNEEQKEGTSPTNEFEFKETPVPTQFDISKLTKEQKSQIAFHIDVLKTKN